LFPVEKSESAVVVSILRDESTRPTTRGTELEAVPGSETLPPVAAPYPVRTRYFPSVERLRSPSDVAVPLEISGMFEPLADVGMATDWTKVPVGVYSSKNTAFPVLAKLSLPVPAR
jgi:hypothetical protein